MHSDKYRPVDAARRREEDLVDTLHTKFYYPRIRRAYQIMTGLLNEMSIARDCLLTLNREADERFNIKVSRGHLRVNNDVMVFARLPQTELETPVTRALGRFVI